MKWLEQFFDRTRKHFEEGGRLARFWPFYESIETVFYAPATVTRFAPNIRDYLDTKRFMMLVILALLPHYLFGIYNVGYQSQLATGLSTELLPVALNGLKTALPIIAVVFLFGFGWEVVFTTIRKHEMSEGVLVTCALFPLTLPPTIPLWQAALGISFGVVIGKEIFGGTGRNFLNPALTGRAFLYFAYPVQNSGDAIWVAKVAGPATVDSITSATPLALAATAERGSDLHAAFVDHGYSAIKLLFGLYPGTIGGTTTFLSIAGAIFLIVLGLASARIILGCVGGLLVTGFLFNLAAGAGTPVYYALPAYQHLLMGGSMFAFAYMATDPVSATHMPKAKWIYGFCIGALTVLIRVLNPAFPEGIGMAVLFMNLFAPLFDQLEIRWQLRKRVTNV